MMNQEPPPYDESVQPPPQNPEYPQAQNPSYQAQNVSYPMAQNPGYPPAPMGYPPPPGQATGYPPAQEFTKSGDGPPATYPQQPVYPLPTGYIAGQPVMTAPVTNVIIRQNGVQPNDYLAFAIIVTICCCLPFGIVAIVKAMEVRNRWINGDYDGAIQASNQAKNWSTAGLVTGFVFTAIYVGVVIAVSM